MLEISRRSALRFLARTNLQYNISHLSLVVLNERHFSLGLFREEVRL